MTRRIEINGREVEVDASVLSYAKLCRLAGLDELRNPSMTYRTYAGAGGILAPGDAVGIASGHP